jgi:hypothetical protein
VIDAAIQYQPGSKFIPQAPTAQPDIQPSAHRQRKPEGKDDSHGKKEWPERDTGGVAFQ